MRVCDLVLMCMLALCVGRGVGANQRFLGNRITLSLTIALSARFSTCMHRFSRAFDLVYRAALIVGCKFDVPIMLCNAQA